MHINVTSLALLVVLLVGANAACTANITSLSDVAAAIKCTTINIQPFTVPAGQALALKLLSGTTVNLLGNITFASGVSWDGAMFNISGSNFKFNGNGFAFIGNGQDYWDGLGGNGGMTKPNFIKLYASGVFSNLLVLNPPEHAFIVQAQGNLTISGVTIDVRAGDAPNSISGGLPAAHNTDGFDISKSTNLTITNCTVYNQDDCFAVNDATNVIISNNTCVGGNGISIGSIKTGNVVSNVLIKNNIIKNSQNGLRIKTYVNNTNANVTNITYSGNTATNISTYGVVIEQDYTNSGATGKPSNTIPITNVNFSGDKSNIAVASKAKPVYVLCGVGSCKGKWDWSMLNVTGGIKGNITNAPITGFTLP